MASWKGSFVATVSIITTFLFSGSLACMCQMKHPQQHVCEADYVIKGRVLAKSAYAPEAGVFTGRYEYRVRVQKDFKGEEQTSGIKKEVKLLTPASEALCGLPALTEGQTYVIAGRTRDEGMMLSMCDWTMDWISLTKSQRHGIKNIYKKNCDKCEIEIANPSRHHGDEPTTPDPLEPFQGCVYDPFGPLRHGTEDCEAKHSSCVEQDVGGCAWLKNTPYQDCLETRNKAMGAIMADQKVGNIGINYRGDW